MPRRHPRQDCIDGYKAALKREAAASRLSERLACIVTSDQIAEGKGVGMAWFMSPGGALEYAKLTTDASGEVRRRMKANPGRFERFRALDDDGEVYFGGWIITDAALAGVWPDQLDEPAYEIFREMMDAYGVTDWQTKDAAGQWQSVYA